MTGKQTDDNGGPGNGPMTTVGRETTVGRVRLKRTRPTGVLL